MLWRVSSLIAVHVTCWQVLPGTWHSAGLQPALRTAAACKGTWGCACGGGCLHQAMPEQRLGVSLEMCAQTDLLTRVPRSFKKMGKTSFI